MWWRAKDVGSVVQMRTGALVGDTYHSIWDFFFLFLWNCIQLHISSECWVLMATQRSIIHSSSVC